MGTRTMNTASSRRTLRTQSFLCERSLLSAHAAAVLQWRRPRTVEELVSTRWHGIRWRPVSCRLDPRPASAQTAMTPWPSGKEGEAGDPGLPVSSESRHAPWLQQRRQGRTSCMGPQYSAGSAPRRNENGPTAKAGSVTSPLSLILSRSHRALGGERRVLLSKQ